MRHKKWARFAVAAAGVAIVSACTESPTDQAAPTSPTTTRSAPTAPDAATVAWVDVICEVDSLRSWNPMPPLDATTEPTEADRAKIVTYLTEGRDAFAQAKALLDGLGPAPVPGGDQLVTASQTAVGGLAQQFEMYVQEAQTYPVQDLFVPYRLAQGDIASYTVGITLGELVQQNPTLVAAKSQAPRCR
jgi:hypothetical protein